MRTNVCAELQQKPSDSSGADVNGEKEAIAKINCGAVEVEPELFSKQQEERGKKRKRRQVQTDARDNNPRMRSAGMKSRGEGKRNERGIRAVARMRGG